ncbi:MAG: hypothetical protein HUU10_04360 [Bacteroidetes bacterium]|nr:hypothetical protein [Bacteroidota bacterium]
MNKLIVSVAGDFPLTWPGLWKWTVLFKHDEPSKEEDRHAVIKARLWESMKGKGSKG